MKTIKFNKVNSHKNFTETRLAKLVTDFCEYYLEVVNKIGKTEKYTEKMNLKAKQKKLELCNVDFEKYYLVKDEQT